MPAGGGTQSALPFVPRLFWRRKAALQALAKGGQRQAKSPAEGAQFHDVEPPLAALAFADKGLGLAEALRQILLGQAATLAGGLELPEEDGVLGRRDALVHESGLSIKGEVRIVQNGLSGCVSRSFRPKVISQPYSE